MFQIVGDKTSPYHLSVGIVCVENNLIATIRKSDGILILPRETMYSNESIEQALQRGAQDELGIKIEVVKYLGSLITHFKRPDGTDVEKTTIYFYCKKIRDVLRNPEQDELNDKVEWLDVNTCASELKNQANEEFLMVNKVLV